MTEQAKQILMDEMEACPAREAILDVLESRPTIEAIKKFRKVTDGKSLLIAVALGILAANGKREGLA